MARLVPCVRRHCRRRRCRCRGAEASRASSTRAPATRGHLSARHRADCGRPASITAAWRLAGARWISARHRQCGKDSTRSSMERAWLSTTARLRSWTRRVARVARYRAQSGWARVHRVRSRWCHPPTLRRFPWDVHWVAEAVRESRRSACRVAVLSALWQAGGGGVRVSL